MKARTFAGSFRPGADSTPLATSTAAGEPGARRRRHSPARVLPRGRSADRASVAPPRRRGPSPSSRRCRRRRRERRRRGAGWGESKAAAVSSIGASRRPIALKTGRPCSVNDRTLSGVSSPWSWIQSITPLSWRARSSSSVAFTVTATRGTVPASRAARARRPPTR